jgi:hypothetical protein
MTQRAGPMMLMGRKYAYMEGKRPINIGGWAMSSRAGMEVGS